MIKLFEEYSEYKEVEQWCISHLTTGAYKINDDLTIDVSDDVYLDNRRYTELPFAFGEVDGDFDVSSSHFTTLKGFPKVIQENLYMNKNYLLTTLEHFPLEVNGNVELEDTPISSLIYIPKGTHIVSLYGTNLPQEIRDEDEYIDDIINNQMDYNIWNFDGTLNYARFELMMKEIK